MYTITNTYYHVKVVDSRLMLLYFSFNSTMFSGYCKKCNNLFLSSSPSSNTFFICCELVDLLR